jgi:hypothetical protein
MLLGLIAQSEGTATINGRFYRQLPSRPDAVGVALDSCGGHPGRIARNHLRVHALASASPDAIARGVFGIPTELARRMLFWGDDSLDKAAAVASSAAGQA